LIKVSDYVANFLLEKGVNDVFLVSGGGMMYLLDSVGRSDLHYYCNYHEQASAVATEGYTRIRGFGACMATTGPGAVNLLSGILGAWHDSLPMLALVGQVRRPLIADYTKMRQLGPQEGNSVAMAQPVTKYAKIVMDPQSIRYELERAYHEAVSNRPGPSWLEIPLDVQDSSIDERELQGFVPPETESIQTRRLRLKKQVAQVITMIQAARRPIILAGNGVHLARSEDLLIEAINRLQIPSTVTHSSKDVVYEAHPCFQGVVSPNGQRRANFAVQNSDLLISLASGISATKVGFNYKSFAPRAKKIIVDVDEGQVFRQVVVPDLGIVADIRLFLEELLVQLNDVKISPNSRWLGACETWKRRYPILLDDYFEDTTYVNSYVFMDRLSDLLTSDDVIVAGAGLDTVSHYQAFKAKPHQRSMTSGNWGAMGWDLPLAVGACIGAGRPRTICITGDGSVQLNIQELETVRFNNLPVKVFIFNNSGFGSIRATQRNLFDGRLTGSDARSGVGAPSFERISSAYDLAYSCINSNDDLVDGLRSCLSGTQPSLCEIHIAPDQAITPKASAFRRPDGTLESRPLEDMAPFLPREEVYENMHLFDDEEAGG
jgi:acetolactate synthase I/II/III large subunit